MTRKSGWVAETAHTIQKDRRHALRIEKAGQASGVIAEDAGEPCRRRCTDHSGSIAGLRRRLVQPFQELVLEVRARGFYVAAPGVAP